jgi:hypothetical protein
MSRSPAKADRPPRRQPVPPSRRPSPAAPRPGVAPVSGGPAPVQPSPQNPAEALALQATYGNAAVARAAAPAPAVPPQPSPAAPSPENPPAPAPVEEEPAAGPPAAQAPPSPQGAPAPSAQEPAAAAPAAAPEPAGAAAGGAPAAAPAPAEQPTGGGGGAGGPGGGGGAAGGGGGGGAAPEAPALDAGSAESLLQSLRSVPASAFSQAVGMAEAETAGLQTREMEALAASLPKTDWPPAGMPHRLAPAQPAPTAVEGGEAPEMEAGGGQGAPPETEPSETTGALPAAQVSASVQEPEVEEEGSWWDWLWNAVRSFLSRLPTSDPNLSTSAGERPALELSGDADPAHMTAHQEASQATAQDARTRADAAVLGDFGENDIYPVVTPETLSPSYQPGGPAGAAGGGPPAGAPAVPAEALAAFNQAAAAPLSEKVAEQAESYRAQKEEAESRSESARLDAEAQVAAETERARAEQDGMRERARGEVDGYRRSWEEENQALQDEFDVQSEARRREVDQQIEDQTRATDEQVETELSRAEQQAEDERIRAEEEAADKKREAENQSEGFWESVKGGISAYFEGLKQIVNAIFDGLRWLVRNILELAKQLVLAIIELARIVIVGLIFVFGEVLKGLVTVLLFAFPETAARWREAIDGAVETTIGWVNTAAEALKAFYTFIYDFLATTLDMLLRFVQVGWTVILEILRLLATGELDELLAILETFAGAMWDGMGMVEGEIYRELLGFDLTKDLGPQLLGGEGGPAGERETPGEEAAGDPANIAFLLQDGIRGDQVVVSPAGEVEADEDLLDELDLEDGQEMSLGEDNDPERSSEAVIRELLEPLADRGPGTGAPEEGATEAGQDPLAQEAAALDPEMSAIVARAFTAETRGERLSVVKDLVWAGLKRYWRETIEPNLWWIIPTAIVTIAAVIALEIVTEGAITAVLIPLLQIIAGAMLAHDLAKMAGHMTVFLERGMAKDRAGAAQAFAKALATGVVAVLMLLLFEIVGQALKVVGKIFARAARAIATGVAKGAKVVGGAVVRGGKALVQGVLYIGRLAVRAAKVTARLVGRSGRVVLERGILFFRGIGSALLRGAKAVGELFQRLRAFFRRFKGFSVQRDGGWIKVYAIFNPRILVALIRAKWTQTWSTRKNAKILRNNMVASGKKLRPGEAAHHIVPSTHPRAEVARRLLRKLGIDINGSPNGVALGRDLHSGLHTHKYIDEVTVLLRGARTQQEAIRVLEKIAKRIKAGTFP